MKLQYNNFENVDLAALDTSISNAFDSFAFLDSFDPYSFFPTTESNTKLVGTYHNGARITVTGDHFLDDSPLVTITSIVMSRPNIDSLKVSGNVSFNYDTGLYSGYYSSYSLQSITNGTSLSFAGKLNVNANSGDITGGTASLMKVTNNDFSFTIKGSMSVNADMVMTGGKVSDFSITDDTGNLLSFSGMSLGAKTFDQLFDASQSDLNPLFNYISANLSGDFAILAGSGDQTLVGNSGHNILDGGTGADSLIGGKGNDTYFVDNAGDTVTELANQGTDVIKASFSYTLDSANGANVENLILTDGSANGGTANLNGTGNALANTITGNAGSNILDGGDGVDKLIGGNGNDTYIVDLIRTGTTAANYKVALQDAITETAVVGSGIDTVELRSLSGTDYSVMTNATTLTLGANLENLDASATGTTRLNLTGNTLANTLTGNDANNILDGGKGIDSLTGGLGDDTYVLDLKVSAGNIVFEDTITELNGTTEGIDTVKLRGTATLTTPITLALDSTRGWQNIEVLDASATGTTKLNLTGNDLGNTLIGNAAANILIGGINDDTLNGGAGIDNMTGGDGDDTYIVDNIRDVVTENANEGTDLIKTSITYSLASTANIENLELIGIAAINATGNNDANIIKGNAGNNIIDGGLGADTLIGGKGNDTYIVDDIGDVIIEDDKGGIDLIKTNITYSTLPDYVENLLLTGTDNINGTGNTLANSIAGNAGNNILDGGDGVDKLAGGNGNDTYIVDLIRTGTTAANYKVALQDAITETAVVGSGIDTVELRSLSGTDYSVMTNATTLTLGANLENLDASATGTTRLNLTGNTLANTLTGNDANNILDGGKGIDSLTGGLGDDTYVLDLKVSAGNIVFEDTITELNGTTEGIDTVKLRGTATLTTPITLALDSTRGWQNIEVLDASATGTTKLNLTGNDLGNTLIGNAAANILIGGINDDTLNGGAGIDNMTGGDGDDTYIVDNIRDVVTENANEGTDLIKTSITYSLASTANIENLELIGIAAINATGNNDANIIKGNAGNNIIDGGLGADTLIGGKGNDTYIVDDIGDVIIEDDKGGIDLIKTNITYSTLPDYVENLLLTGTDNINGTGNTLANSIAGNAGNNILDGGDGVDKLAGGNGNDTYIVDLIRTGTTAANYKVALQDAITETAVVGSGIDTVELRSLSGTDYSVMTNATTLTLGANLENLDASATGTTRLNLTGNTLANTLTGNDANNILDGGKGNDILVGGLGNDTLKGGLGADVFKWSTSDLVTPGDVSGNIDTITDFSILQSDQLDFKDLLIDKDNIENYIDIVFQNGATHISISSTGNFMNGNYNAAEEDAHIVLANTNLFTATNTSNEAQLIGFLTQNNHLMIE